MESNKRLTVNGDNKLGAEIRDYKKFTGLKQQNF